MLIKMVGELIGDHEFKPDRILTVVHHFDIACIVVQYKFIIVTLIFPLTVDKGLYYVKLIGNMINNDSKIEE